MNSSDRPSWKLLQQHLAENSGRHLSEFFAADPERFERFSRRQDGLLFDFSKQRVDEQTLKLLCQLASECELDAWIDKLFGGGIVNGSEQRPALHSALRLPAGSELVVYQRAEGDPMSESVGLPSRGSLQSGPCAAN